MGSRVKNSLRNSFWGATTNIVITFLNFIVRTIFIKVLGNEYLGINGLFTNILYVLNFAELGIGHAIIYNLYKPVAENDKERIKTLVNLYKRIYFIIGLLVLGLGLLVLPFMNFIIKETPDIKESLSLIYLIYLLETTCVYFFGYKRSLLLVYQKNYINSLIDLICSVLKSLIQTFILIYTKDYMLYLLVFLLSTLVSNIYIYLRTNKDYPFLKEKNIIKATKEEIKEIFINVKSLFLYKLGNTVLSGTDNIILSMLIGINAVGLYSNYSLIITAVSGILWTILSGLTGSIGNLNVYKDKNHQMNIFNEVLFLSSLLYGFGTLCLGLLLNSFITIWIGEEFLLSNLTVIFLVVVCYLRGVAFPANVYRDTLGLFKEGRIMPFICSIINISLSILLGKLMGIKGVFLATIISIVTTTFWYMPKLIYKKVFDMNFFSYLKKIFIFTMPFIISYFICNNILNLFFRETLLIFIVKSLIVVMVTLIIYIVIEHNQREYKEIKRKLFEIIKKRKV